MRVALARGFAHGRAKGNAVLLRCFHVLMFYVLLIHLAAMSLTWNLVSALIYPFIPRRHGLVLGRAAISSVYRGFWATAQWLGLMRVDCSALDALAQDGGLIIAANHPSMLDAMLIVARVPRGVCIMRASLMRNPFLGAGAKLARYISNDPLQGMFRCAIANLKAGGQLVMFPEGTRTVESPVNPFRPGITMMAKMAGVPIQTVLIEAESRYLCKGWPIWRVPVFPTVFRARLGERFDPEPDHKSLLARIESYFKAELAAAPRRAG